MAIIMTSKMKSSQVSVVLSERKTVLMMTMMEILHMSMTGMVLTKLNNQSFIVKDLDIGKSFKSTCLQSGLTGTIIQLFQKMEEGW